MNKLKLKLLIKLKKTNNTKKTTQNKKRTTQKNKNENKTYLNGYADFEESLFWRDSKSIRSNNDNKNDYNDKSK